MIDARSELKRGLLWVGGATLLAKIVDVGATLALLFFLTRQDMGLASLAWSIGVVVEAFSGLGVGYSLVRAPQLSAREVDSLFWFCSVMGVVLMLVAMVASPLISDIYGDPRLTPMISVSATKMVFVGAAVVPQQMLARELRFRESGAAQTVTTAIDAITKLTLAAFGLGAWALVIANALRGVVFFVVVQLFARYRPRLRFSLADVRGHVWFGLRVASSGILFHLYRNADYFLVGRYLGLESLGVYRVGFEIAMSPQEVILNVVNRVAYPVYARLAGDHARLVEAFHRSVRYFLLLLGPIALLLFFGADDLYSTIFEPRWHSAVPVVRILCWAGLLRGLALLFPQTFAAAGKPQLGLYDSIVAFVTLVGGFVIALEVAPPGAGLAAICWAWIVSYPLLLTNLFLLSRLAAPVAPWAYLRNLAPALLALAIMAAAMAGASLLRPYSPHPAIALALTAVAGLGAYALCLRVVLRMRMRDLIPRRAGD